MNDNISYVFATVSYIIPRWGRSHDQYPRPDDEDADGSRDAFAFALATPIDYGKLASPDEK